MGWPLYFSKAASKARWDQRWELEEEKEKKEECEEEEEEEEAFLVCIWGPYIFIFNFESTIYSKRSKVFFYSHTLCLLGRAGVLSSPGILLLFLVTYT